MRMKRILSVLLIVCLLAQLIVFVPVAHAATRATHSGSLAMGGISIDYDATLVEEDGSYTFALSIASLKTEEQHNTDTRTAKNGTYRVSKDGWYFIELWGGKGADGADTTEADGSLGGTGGAAGHVYAKVYLEKGQTLFYTLGGNGVPTYTSEEGGGINGNGGHHGASGSDTVGGGGGYSAVFFYEKNEFEAKYGSASVSSIDETDRISRYIMIAGGGGGGAGNGTSLIGTKATGTADGGAGGTLTSASGIISGSGIVEGTFFAGGDGKSSGSSVSYVGKGGTNLPGAVPDTWITNLKGKQPNDWAGTNNPEYLGGAGGSGNLRGGAGGAGFCGGSGGVMTGQIIPTNVGGGGGGSSFLASTLNGHTINYTETADANAYKKNENPSEMGGAFCITYLGEMDVSFLENLTLSASLSDYFLPFDHSVTSGDMHHGSDIRDIVVEGISLLTDGGETGGSLTATLKFRPIDGFAGGNNVPILGKDIILTAPALESGGQKKIDLRDGCTHLNVPLNLPIVTHSFESGEPGELFYVDDFYTDNYADIRSSLSSDVRYDFIQEIGEYGVLDLKDNVLEGTVFPEKTTVYRVYFDVSLKDTGYAEVGTRLSDTRVSGTATVDVMNSISDTVGAYGITYTKGLSYNGDGLYTLSLNVTSSVSETGEIIPDEGVNHHQMYTETLDSFEHPVATSGYYLIRLWGGDGGKGANALLLGGKGGAGGAGGYVEGYLYLEKGQYIKGTIGKDGGNGSSYAGGGGGGYTYIEILDENKQSIKIVAVAAGGGGGGGAYWTSHGDQGMTPSSTTSSYAGSLGAYAGGAGAHGSNGGDAGTASNNFRDSSVFSTQDTAKLSEEAINTMKNAIAEDTNTSENGGAVFIHFLMSDRSPDTLIKEFDSVLSEYTISTVISKYFTVLGANVMDAYGTPTYEYTAPNFVSGADTTLTFANINPTINVVDINVGETVHLHADVDFTVEITLSPAEGFMGGNDVPLLRSASFSHIQYSQDTDGTVTVNNPSIALRENVATDYANVEIGAEAPKLTGHDVFSISAGSTIPKDALFTVEGALPKAPEAGDANAWKYDYVTVTDTYSGFADAVSPTVTTSYTAEIGVTPKDAAEKAIAGPATEGYLLSETATVYIGYRVNYELKNLDTSDTLTEGTYWVEIGSDYSARLIPHEGFFLPEQITITVGDRTLTAGEDFVYDAKSGEFTVYAEAIDGEITVIAAAKGKTYTLHFVYMRSPSSTSAATITEEYEAGADLSNAIFHTFTPRSYQGYRFVLDFGDGSSVAPAEMPEKDIWVTGLYVKEQYNLLITYRDEAGNTLPGVSDYSATLSYGEEYSVPSPIVKGYLANAPLIEGTMPAVSIVLNVVYREHLGVLSIIYLRQLPDGSIEQVGRYTDESLRVGDSYLVSTNPIVGYTPDVEAVEGVMVEEGVTVYVTYEANHYTVNFSDPEGGNVFTPITVIYDHIYGYFSSDESAFAYGALPTPLRAGYVFAGWVLDGEKVTEETAVSTASDHTLTAKWEAVSYTVTVRYVYEDGSEAASTVTESLPFGTLYSYASPAVYGYTPDKATVVGAIPAQNTVIAVVYKANSFTLTVEYRDSITEEELAPKVCLTLRHGEEYAVSSPIVDGYDTVSVAIVSGTADAPAENTHLLYTVYYYVSDPTISVTVSWGTLTFDLTGRGEWDPETHTYAKDSFSPASPDQNKVTVENSESSSIGVVASYSYTPFAEYGALNAFFTQTASETAEHVQESGELRPGEWTEAYVWVEGNMPANLTEGVFITGTCSVIIRGGKS